VVPIETMLSLRSRDWLDAFGEADRVPGCGGVCISPNAGADSRPQPGST
jgi:hypothetical protein